MNCQPVEFISMAIKYQISYSTLVKISKMRSKLLTSPASKAENYRIEFYKSKIKEKNERSKVSHELKRKYQKFEFLKSNQSKTYFAQKYSKNTRLCSNVSPASSASSHERKLSSNEAFTKARLKDLSIIPTQLDMNKNEIEELFFEKSTKPENETEHVNISTASLTVKPDNDKMKDTTNENFEKCSRIEKVENSKNDTEVAPVTGAVDSENRKWDQKHF